MSYETILYATDGAIASITLNRPERLNTIVPPLPEELEQAVIEANREPAVGGIILRGAGRPKKTIPPPPARFTRPSPSS